MSIKIQVIFYSMYGHVYRMAEAVAEGAKQVLGAGGSRHPSANELKVRPLPGQASRRKRRPALPPSVGQESVIRPESLALTALAKQFRPVPGTSPSYPCS